MLFAFGSVSRSRSAWRASEFFLVSRHQELQMTLRRATRSGFGIGNDLSSVPRKAGFYQRIELLE